MSVWARMVVVVSLIAALIGCGFFWGSSHELQRIDVRRQAAADAAQRALLGQVKALNEEAAATRRERQDLEDRYAALDVKFKGLRARGIPLVASVCPGREGSAPDGATAPSARIELRVASEPALSLLGVRVWNSALAGVDVPAGACGAAGGAGDTEAACATPAGIGIDEAWSNQADNAKSCAADRARYRRLIGFLKKGQQP